MNMMCLHEEFFLGGVRVRMTHELRRVRYVDRNSKPIFAAVDLRQCIERQGSLLRL